MRKKPSPIRKLLIANRGEIAVRVIRAAHELGISTIAVHSPLDRDSLHVELADESRPLEGVSLADTYLSVEALIAAARAGGADAVHPGYGFLSESAVFARACEQAGLTFVGPPPRVLSSAGDKIGAKEAAAAAGVPTLPFEKGRPEVLSRGASRIGYPVLIKAAGGGGGRGIRVAESPEELGELAAAASREAAAGFGDPTVYVERLLRRARHVEVQVLADASGRVVCLGERECSVQRRHQKLIEESPSPALTAEIRRNLGEAAARVARAVGYRNAGTVEFLLEVDAGLEPLGFYFLEINARIQVEHPVTEAVTGLDLVGWQLRIAAGEQLPPDLEALTPRGHAIECRICAEAPPAFTPAAGTLEVFRPPSWPFSRFDAGVREGDEVSLQFDSLLAKLIAWGGDRRAAIERMRLALRSAVILGADTNLDFLADALERPAFQSGRYTTAFIAEEMAGWSPPPPPEVVRRIARGAVPRRTTAARGPWDLPGARRSAAEGPAAEAAVEWRDAHTGVVATRDRREPFAAAASRRASWVRFRGRTYRLAREGSRGARNEEGSAPEGRPRAPMPGLVLCVKVKEGQSVSAGDLLLTLEAMKIEHEIRAAATGRITRLHVGEGERVEAGALLAEIVEEGGAGS